MNTMTPQLPQIFKPFVYLIDSPSNYDLYNGYSIGMALRDALNAINIPCIYRLTTDQNTFDFAMSGGLEDAIKHFQLEPNVQFYPFIHFCMHGAQEGIGLTNGTFVNWAQLRQSLLNHNRLKGYDPYVCMASCNGINATNMANLFDSAFNVLIGNSEAVLQSDLTVAYLSFYNSFFYKQASFDQAVTTMRLASGDNNFYFAHGQDIKNQRLAEFNNVQHPYV